MSIEISAQVQQLLHVLQESITQQQLLKLVLSKYQGQETALQRITIKPLRLRDELCLCFVYGYQTNDVTKNLNVADGVAKINELLERDFKAANLLTSSQDLQLTISKKGKASLLIQHKKQAITAPNLEHNREKQRFLSLEREFWHDLGVIDTQQQLIPAMSRKWKQINKFIEIFAHALEEGRIDLQQALHIVDFGSGKGYLTFALHDYLRQQRHNPAQVTGIELRDNLVQLCQQAIQRCQLQGLQVYQGDVRSYTPTKLDVMIALHACDVATDYAIHTGIRLGAKVIMCAPCCHKQIRPQMISPAILQPVLQHGVHLGQEAEMITDGLRALLLEACGYQTQVFEFVALEHTSKNKMILAVKKQISLPKQQNILAQIQAIKTFYGIEQHCLESLLQAEGLI